MPNSTTITILLCSFEIHYVTPQSRVMMRVLSAFILIATLTMALLNGYVVIVMTTSKKMRSGHRISLVLLFILVLIDLVGSLVFMPVYNATTWMMSAGKVSCTLHKIVHIMGHALCMLTILTIMFITIQLYLAVVKPFVYQGQHNRRYYWVYLIATWGVTFLLIFCWIFLYPERWGRFKKIIGTSFVTIVFALICFLHVHVHNEVREIMRKGSNNPTLATATATSANQKTIRMTAFVVAVFGFCYLPFAVITVYEFITKGGTDSPAFSTLYVHPWVELAGVSNGVWNPIIYCFRLSFIKRRENCLRHKKKTRRVFRVTTVPNTSSKM